MSSEKLAYIELSPNEDYNGNKNLDLAQSKAILEIQEILSMNFDSYVCGISLFRQTD